MCTAWVCASHTIAHPCPDNRPSRDLSFNRFSGRIPTSVGFLAEVESLYLNNNRFTGPIPKSLKLLSSIKYLRLENNPGLTGTVTLTSSDGVFRDVTNRAYFEGGPQQEWYMDSVTSLDGVY